MAENRRTIKPAIIGAGLGGQNVAIRIADIFKTDRVAAINLSHQDVATTKLPEERTIIIGDQGGAGRNRDSAKSFMTGTLDKMGDLAARIIRSDQESADITLVCFSLSGGTGSGIGPGLTAYLSSEEFASKLNNNRHIVMGIGILPDPTDNITEGLIGMSYTVKALSEINKLVDRKMANFMFVDNSFSRKVDYKEKNTEINTAAANHIHRYFNWFSQSRVGNLDVQDRLAALRHPGVHSLFSYNKVDGGSIRASSPFYIPRGSNALGMHAEIPESDTEVYNDLVSALGIIPDDGKVGFYSSGNSPEEYTMPIVHSSGSAVLTKISETYRERLKQLEAKKSAAENVDRSGKGFNKFGDDKRMVKEAYAVNRLKGSQDLMDLLDDDDD